MSELIKKAVELSSQIEREKNEVVKSNLIAEYTNIEQYVLNECSYDEIIEFFAI
jgi:hypothetical protein